MPDTDEPFGPVGLRERAGAALVRAAADLAEDRRVAILRIAAIPAHSQGRDRALQALALGAWVEQALLWLGWRLLPRHTLFGPTP
jgi:hypothetical protein